MDGRYSVKEIEKGLSYLTKHCQTFSVRIEIGEFGRLYLTASDLTGNHIKITIYDESTQKMPEVQKTERL